MAEWRMGAPAELDPDVVRRFHFTRAMLKGPVYRKYKFAVKRIWNVDDSTSPRTSRTGSGSAGAAPRACSA